MKRSALVALLMAGAAASLSLIGYSQTSPQAAPAQTQASEDNSPTGYSKWSQPALEAELARRAIVERKVLMPMRDGVHLSTDIYRPRNASGPVPTVFVRTPYNMNTLTGSSLRQAVEAVDRGYAIIYQNERGRYFSEGKYEILGYPRTDGYDALTWIADQPWSNKKVGTLGCSSTAEWQLQLAATHHPAHAAMIPMSSGAGIGRVGDFYEQGNWYRGGVPRILFGPWLYDTDNPLRAQIPEGLDPQTRQRLSQYSDLNPAKPKVDWTKQVARLPYSELLSSLGEPAGTFEQLIARLPDDPAWYKGGLYHDNEKWGVPALWFDSWYDVSSGPNLALYNHAVKSGVDANVRDNQYAVIGPNVHCGYYGLGPNFKSGDRQLGDASFDVTGQVWAFFDRFLKGQASAFPSSTAKVRYFSMGDNVWKTSQQWPPKEASDVKLYFHSNGRANSMYGDGKLSFTEPGNEPADAYVYDPKTPVQTIGGGDCCNGGVVVPGAYDQRPVEVRHDVLVYTSDPLKEKLVVAGFVNVFLSVSSDVKDTDFAVKLVDVAPDGTAYILDDTIFRARFREGYNKEVMMRPGETYSIKPTPMSTANVFLPGHRIRVEVTSSNFPKFVRNLNTGGRNEFESVGQVANNQIRHAKAAPSYIVLPVVK
ncbi:MAG TPA: CocE/NonD family hydrolase [Hyphomonadaceae bacterium]|nr:CocE/NonD family hydrolase [Hyphomonadaceae bacterium]